MAVPPDRNVARAALAVAAMVFAIVIATVESPTRSAATRRTDPSVLRALVQFATRSDRLDVRIDYGLERSTTTGLRLTADFVSWFRANPLLIVRSDAGSFVADSEHSHVDCRQSSTGDQCFESSARARSASGAELYFDAIRIAQRYRAETGPARRIANEKATCFRIVKLVGAVTIPSLGDRLEICYGADGAMLLTDIVRGASHDVQTARRVRRGFDVVGYEALLRRFRNAPLIKT